MMSVLQSTNFALCSRIFHWQVDIWNKSTIKVTIHNSAKITLTVEEGARQNVVPWNCRVCVL